MKDLPIRLLLMLAGIALVLGATHRQLLDFFTGQDARALPEGQAMVEIPEGGVRSDSFSLSLLHEALAAGKGPVCICPAAMVELLRQLHVISGETTRQLIERQVPGLLDKPGASAVMPPVFAQLYADIGLPFAEGASASEALRMPLREDITRALPLISEHAAGATGGFAAHMLDNQPISQETRLLALSASLFERPWRAPFRLLGPHEDRDFNHADGSIRPARMMACRDLHSVARAADGSWEAVALFFRNEGREGSPACFVAILPAPGVDARRFGRELSAAKLSEIRRELALAAPRELTVVMPQLQMDSPALSLQALLLRLGLGKLFTRAADFSGLCREPLHLDLALGKYAFSLEAEDAGTSPETPPGSTLRLNRPFLWFIGDLTTANPPAFMGLTE